LSFYSTLFRRIEEISHSRMQFLFSSLVILIASACVFVQAKSDNNNDKEENFRAGRAQPSHEVDLSKNQGRFIFKTVTLSLQTSTFTTVTTSVTTCTTSTAGLSVCTASGRRRRGLHLSGNKEGRGLFYNEKEEYSEDGSIFLPSPVKYTAVSFSPKKIIVRNLIGTLIICWHIERRRPLRPCSNWNRKLTLSAKSELLRSRSPLSSSLDSMLLPVLVGCCLLLPRQLSRRLRLQLAPLP
jgi:hypothetical protein